MNHKIAFIGGGNMAQAILSALIKNQLFQADNILVIEPNEATCQYLESRFQVTARATDFVDLQHCHYVFLAVKPQLMSAALQQYSPFLNPQSVIISIAAGITIHSIERQIPCPAIIRVMPNTPVAVGQGASGFYANQSVTPSDIAQVQQILAQLGVVVQCATEQQLDAVTALSGSGPAYVFLFLEHLIKGGIQLGLSTDAARTLALATLKGAVGLLEQSEQTPEVLRQQVTSKGGTTAAALDCFAQGNWGHQVEQAMQAAAHRAEALSQMFSEAVS